MEVEGQSSEPEHRTFCTIMGNYSRHMAFAMDPPFCMAYPLDFVVKEDPAQMTFRSQQNHPVSFTRDGLLVHQLLAQDCPECEYAMATCNGCLLIPRGMQFPKDLFPEIVILCNHAEPYRDPKTGKEAPFVTVGPFARRDMLFCGIARDLELYTMLKRSSPSGMWAYLSPLQVPVNPSLSYHHSHLWAKHYPLLPVPR